MCMPDICRACMIHEPGMPSIFTPTNHTPIDTMFLAITSIQPLRQDGLPPQICKVCLEMLEKCYKFRQKIIKSDIKFRQAQTLPQISQSSKYKENDIANHANVNASETDDEQDEIFMDHDDDSSISGGSFDDLELQTNELLQQNTEIQNKEKNNTRKLQIVQVMGDYNVEENTLKMHSKKHKEKMELFSQLDEDSGSYMNDKSNAKKRKVLPTDCKIEADLSINDESTSEATQFPQFVYLNEIQFNSVTTQHSQKSALEVVEVLDPEDNAPNTHSIKQEKEESSSFTDASIDCKKEKRWKLYKQKMYSCNLCDYKGTQIKRHLSAHLTEKPYVCEKCNGAYTRNDNLISHKRICSGKPIIRCPACNTHFTMQIKLQKHLTTERGAAACQNLQRTKIISLDDYFDSERLRKFYTGAIG